MGLLDRYGVNGEEQPREENAFAQRGGEAPHDKLAKMAIEDPFAETKTRIHNAIIEQQIASGETVTDESMRKLIDEYVEKPEYNIPRVDRDTIKEQLYDDIMGYGPIQCLVDSDEYSEIMVNGYDHVYVESHGKLVLTDIKFKDNDHLMQIVDRIVSRVGRHVDEASPMCDARLLDGSRVNVIIPPVSLVGPILTIRKFGKTPISAENLLTWGSVNLKMLNFLEAAVKGKLNIIVSGGTGSGKTTLLNVLSSYIPHDERIITIEDSAELQIQGIENLIRLETRNENVEGCHAITIRDLIKSSLRMRPDRIIVGEVRGSEAGDMITAFNTGHDGSMSTGHANSARDMLSRLENMILMGMDIPLAAVKQQIASAIDIMIHLGRIRDKSRRVLEITEIDGIQDGEIKMHTLYEFTEDASPRIGVLQKKGQLQHVEKLKAAGLML